MTVLEFLQRESDRGEVKPPVIAERLGVTRQAVWSTLNRKIGIVSIDTLKRYCKAAKINLKFIQNKTPQP